MKKIFCLLAAALSLAAYSYDTATMEDVAKYGQALTVGSQHICILNLDGVLCYGDNQYGQSTVPTLHHPKQVSAGILHTCAIDDTGVVCWGNNKNGETSAPHIKNPRWVVAGQYWSCAIEEDDDVRCWGANPKGTNSHHLSGAKQIAIGYEHVCGVGSANRVECWGDGSIYGEVHSGGASAIKVTAGIFRSCGFTGSSVSCWGEFDLARFPLPTGATVAHAWQPVMNHPRMLTGGDRHACVIDDDGVKCWGIFEYGENITNVVARPKIVAAGARGTCVIDEADGLTCRGQITKWLPNVPSEAITGNSTVHFNLLHLPESLRKVARLVVPAKRAYFEGLAKLAEKFPVDTNNPYGRSADALRARMLILEMALPILETTNSEGVQKRVLPEYHQAYAAAQKRLGMSEAAIAQPADMALVSIEVARLALESCREFVVDKTRLDDMEKLLGKLGMLGARLRLDPNLAGSGQLAAVLQEYDKLLDYLVTKDRTRGFGELLTVIRASGTARGQFFSIPALPSSGGLRSPEEDTRPPASQHQPVVKCVASCYCESGNNGEAFSPSSRRYDEDEAREDADFRCMNYSYSGGRVTTCNTSKVACQTLDVNPSDAATYTQDARPRVATRWRTDYSDNEKYIYWPVQATVALGDRGKPSGAIAYFLDNGNRPYWVSKIRFDKR